MAPDSYVPHVRRLLVVSSMESIDVVNNNLGHFVFPRLALKLVEFWYDSPHPRFRLFNHNLDVPRLKEYSNLGPSLD